MRARNVAVAVAIVGGLLAGAPPSRAQDAGEAVARALRGGQHAEALRLADEALRGTREQADARLWTLRGLALRGLKRDQESLAAYRKALAIDARYLPALQGAAGLEYEGRRPEASVTLRRILAVDPANVVAHAMLGALAYERQDCDRAIDHFAKSGQALQANAAALDQFGHCLYLAGRAAEAVDAFRAASRLTPDDEQARLKVAIALQAAGASDEARAILEPLARQAANGTPASEPTPGERSARERRPGEATPGEPTRGEPPSGARQSEPGSAPPSTRPDAAVFDLLAEVYVSLDRVKDAIDVLRRAIALRPAEEAHYLALVSLCLERDSFDLALEVADVGLRHLPRSARLHALRGVVQAQRGVLEQAEAEFIEADRLDPARPAGAVGRGLAIEQTGRPDEAIALLRKTTARHPRDAGAKFLLAQALIRRGVTPGSADAREAGALLKDAVTLAPDMADAHTELGKLRLRSGDAGGAVGHLERALALAPNDRTATYQLAIALRQTGRAAEAAKATARMRDLMRREREDEVRRNRQRLMKVSASPSPSAAPR